MNIKSLLLGSAVASVAFTGAQAADAIFVPEPEPMEYVRVCDVYGAGFFYIPGTETCLKIGGYVRYQIDFDEDHFGESEGFRKFGRAQLTVDARSETELGTLRSFAELWFSQHANYGEVWNPEGIYSNNNNSLNVRQAFIELGGLFVGIKTTLWDGALAGEYDNFGYDSRVHTIGYNFAAANGINVALALEEYDFNYDYTPNVVGKVGIKQGWGTVNLFAAYDATAEEWAAKAIAAIKLSDPLTLELGAAYASGASWYSPKISNLPGTVFGAFGAESYEWSLGAHLKYAVNEKLALGIGGQYWADNHLTGFNDWSIGAVADYEVVKGFATKLAINYYDGDTFDATGLDGHWGGFLRLQRSF